ncbi:MAG: hypothetical protein ACYCQJ_09680 [Nitrososphaerales archaeon]
MLSSTKEQSQKKEIKAPTFIETESINDIGRLACALERAPLPLFALKNEGKNMIATQLDLFMGVPIYYFSYSPEVKHFLGYRTTQTGEEITLVDAPTNPTLVHAPIIEIVKVPQIFQQGLDKAGSPYQLQEKFLWIEVKDLVSLIKVASYKMLFEEPPLPIFAFPVQGKWCIGAFTRIEDYEEGSTFFYYLQDTKPEQNFVRYSMNKADAMFTSRTEEHGYVYVKLIKLKHTHPLVDLQGK